MENDEQNKQTCQCVLRVREDELPCTATPDPMTGEALLCTFCWQDTGHNSANMTPKRLPKRSLIPVEGTT